MLSKVLQGKRKWWPLMGVAGILIVGGIALAAIMARAPLTGEAQVKGIKVDFANWPGESPTVVASSGVTCTPTIDDPSGTMNVLMADALPGSFCDIKARLTKVGQGSASFLVQNAEFNSIVQTSFVVGCGLEVPDDTMPPLFVTIRFAIPPDATDGNYPADANAGVTAVPAVNYVDTDCPRPV